MIVCYDCVSDPSTIITLKRYRRYKLTHSERVPL
jgi:hypothetical protein